MQTKECELNDKH